MAPSIRESYEDLGAARFYREMGGRYRNPHEQAVVACFCKYTREWGLNISQVLDLACGSGEITLAVKGMGGAAVGVDPYTGQAYKERTGQIADPLTFEQIAQNGLGEQRFSLICCSYALHLVQSSWLPALTYQLGQVADSLLVLSPHKKPDLPFQDLISEGYEGRVRARLYRLRS